MSTDIANSGTGNAMRAGASRARYTAAVGLVAYMLAAPAMPLAQGQAYDGDPDAVQSDRLMLAYLASADELKDARIDDLKNTYLSCDRAAMGGKLDTPGIMLCSIVYEELKHRAFGGDFDKLLAWSNTHPSVEVTGQ